jgi:hypothetical protein
MEVLNQARGISKRELVRSMSFSHGGSKGKLTQGPIVQQFGRFGCFQQGFRWKL